MPLRRRHRLRVARRTRRPALLGSAVGVVLPATAVAYANAALLGFIALGALMLVGGAWFVYYIRQEGAQITHLVMIGVGIAAVQMMNGV